MRCSLHTPVFSQNNQHDINDERWTILFQRGLPRHHVPPLGTHTLIPLSQAVDLRQISTQALPRITTQPQQSTNKNPVHCCHNFTLLLPRVRYPVTASPQNLPSFFPAHMNTTRKNSFKNSGMVARRKQPYSQPLFRKFFLGTYTTKTCRSTKCQILQELKTSFKSKATRNLSSHQLSPIETKVLALSINFVPITPSSTHYQTQF